MKKIVLFVVTLGLLLSQLSSADTDNYYNSNTSYGGVGLVYSNLEYNQANVDFDYSQANYKVLVGHKYDSLSLEAQYTTVLGDVDVSVNGVSAASNLEVDGYSFGLAGLYYFNRGLFAKIGLHKWDIEVTNNTTDTSAKIDDNDLFYGLGYEISERGNTLRLEYERFKLGGTIDDSMNNFSISAIWSF